MLIRKYSKMFCAGIFLMLFLFPAAGEAQSLKITLLGTGSPVPAMDRFGPSTLVEANKNIFLFDCGRGAAQRIWQRRIPLGRVTSVFLTHLHSDHVVGIPDLWLTGWTGVVGDRKTPLQMWGPTGTKEMMSYLEKAFQADYRIRIEDEKLPPETFHVIAQDITEGVVYEKDGVKITAFEVDHFPGKDIEPCLGYRLDYAGRSVVISGDTRFSENLIRFSKGVDVLIHEVAAARDGLSESPVETQRIMAHHVSPEEAGKIFSQVSPKLAVYYHFVLVGGYGAPPTIENVITRTRKTYSGPLDAGEDQMIILVGDTVEVIRPSR